MLADSSNNFNWGCYHIFMLPKRQKFIAVNINDEHMSKAYFTQSDKSQK